MFSEIAPVLILVAGALLILAGTELARRAKLPETIGSGAALWLIAIGLGLFVANWRAWEAGGAWGDRLLTYARWVGLTGMMFLAGTSFRAKLTSRGVIVSLAVLGALLFITTTLLLRFLLNQAIGPAALVAATVVGSSVWFPSQDEKVRSPINFAGAIALSGIAMLGLYFADVLGAIPNVRRTPWVSLIVIAYELVKLTVLFAFAYFVSTRFLARAAGRVSVLRTNIGFILISILFFALISLTAGQLGALAWAFIAGALWRQTDLGDKFSRRAKPVASALLLSFVFLSLPLQSHGRTFTSFTALLVVVIVAIALKVFFAWIALKRHLWAAGQGGPSLAALAFPGEMATLLLSFSITRWAIDGPMFFTVLGVALLSSLMIPILYAGIPTAVTLAESRRSVMKSGIKKVLFTTFCVAIISFSFTTSASQQSVTPPTTQEVQLGTGMSAITPGLMEIGSKTKLFLLFTDKVPFTPDQQRKLEGLFLEVQMYSVQKEADLDVADAELKRLLTRDTVDLGAVRTKMREIESIRFDNAMKKIETLLRAIGVLSHEQHIKIILLARDLESGVKPREPVY